MVMPVGCLNFAEVPVASVNPVVDPANTETFVYSPDGTAPPTFVGEMAVIAMFRASTCGVV
jgi:hypothetical protein